MYLCARNSHFDILYDFSIEVWKSSDSGFVFNLSTNNKYLNEGGAVFFT